MQSGCQLVRGGQVGRERLAVGRGQLQRVDLGQQRGRGVRVAGAQPQLGEVDQGREALGGRRVDVPREPLSRTVFGPHVLTRYEAALGLLDGQGLAAIEVTGCVAAVESFTRGAASAVVEAEQAPERTGRSDDEWWERRAPLLDERMDGRFPRLAALADAGAFAVSSARRPYTLQRALDRFDFGLDLVLDSVGARIEARA